MESLDFWQTVVSGAVSLVFSIISWFSSRK